MYLSRVSEEAGIQAEECQGARGTARYAIVTICDLSARHVLTQTPAQVEGMLRTVGKQRASRSARSDGAGTEGSSPLTLGRDTARSERFQSSPLEGPMPWIPHSSEESPSSGDNGQSRELLGLGRFESLPPLDMIEDLYVPEMTLACARLALTVA
jgi:hypothetical protein